MDKHVNEWILEFLALKQISPPFLNAMLSDPKFSVVKTKNPRLKRAICLHTIHDKLSIDDVAIELVLDSLEIMEELDRKEGNLITESMKLAYCAVAVECTVKYLRIPGPVAQEEEQGWFFEAVERIWRGRIGKMELTKESELVTDKLRELKEEMEAALWDSKARERLLGRVGKAEALRLVRVFVKEALVIMGPSFIELAIRSAIELRRKRKHGDKFEIREPRKRNTAAEVAAEDGPATQELKRQRVGMKEGSKSNADPEIAVLDGSPMEELKRQRVEIKEGSKSNADPEIAVLDGSPMEVRMKDGSKQNAGPQLVDLDGHPREEIDEIQQRNDGFDDCFSASPCDIMDSQNVETGIRPTKFNFNLVPTPEFVKVRESLKHSLMELKALVNDPLPEALRVSDALRDEIRERSLNKETLVEDQNGNDINAPSPTIHVEVSAKEILNPVPLRGIPNMKNGEIPMSSNQTVPPKRSSMERNSTAYTLEVPEIRGKSLNQETSAENQNGIGIDAHIPIINAEVSGAAKEILNPVPLQAIPNVETNAELPTSNSQIVPPKRSLMERSSTAFTFEWNDSMDGPPSQEATNSVDKDKVATESSRKKAGPWKVKNFAGRRRPNKWSLEEEDQLRKAVKRFGLGNWTLILNTHREIFIERTAGDLKDKWRNMSKFGDPLKELGEDE